MALADLAAEPLILLDHPPSLEYYTSILAAAGVNPQFRFRTGSFEMVGRWSLAASGHPCSCSGR